MPKRDPFADGRRKSNGASPTQAKKKKNAARVRTQRNLPKKRKELESVKNQIIAADQKLLMKKQMLEMMESAPTPAQQRKVVLAMFANTEYNPIEALIEFATERDDDGEYTLPQIQRIMVAKELASHFSSKPKSIDLQATVQSEVTIQVVDFSKTTQAEVKRAAQEAKEAGMSSDVIDVTPTDEPDYSEFQAPEESVEGVVDVSDSLGPRNFGGEDNSFMSHGQ